MNPSPAILVAHSEPGTRAALVDALLRAEYQAISVADGTLALGLCHKRSFDLVVLDAALAGASAPRVCRELRRSQARLPLLLLTSRAADPAFESLAGDARTEVLLMPYGVSQFLARVAVLLDGRP